jgi:hypothetical protein
VRATGIRPRRVETGCVRRLTRSTLAALFSVLALAWAPSATADLADEEALAERFAPVVRLVEQEAECEPGEPYDPLDVELLLDEEPTVALRGPWSGTDLVEIAPSGEDLRNRFEYHLDFPLLARPLLGALLVDWPLAALNIVAGLVYAATLPFVGLVTAYVYFDARTRDELEPVVEQGELPAEIELSQA